MPVSSPEEKAAAQQIWDGMIVAKGGRDRLYAVETVALDERYYLSFGLSFKFKSDFVHDVGVYAFPDRVWGWSNQGKTVFGQSAGVGDLSRNISYLVRPGDDIRESHDVRAEAGSLYRLQLIYFNETRWFKLEPIRVLPRKGLPGSVDAIETFVSTRYGPARRVDFWISRKDHLPARIIEYQYPWYRPPSNPYFTVEYASSDYREIDGITIPHKVLETVGRDTHNSPRMTFNLNIKIRDNLFSKPPRFEEGPDAWKPEAPSNHEIPLAPPTSSVEEQAAAKRIWNQMIEAKGGRERLQAVETLSFEEFEKEVFAGDGPTCTRNGDHHASTVLGFPDRVWRWDDGCQPGYPALAGMNDLAAGLDYWVSPNEAIQEAEPVRRAQERLYVSQLIYFNQSRWFQPKPVRLLSTGIPRGLDAIETYVSSKYGPARRVDFWISRKDHLPTKIIEYEKLDWMPPTESYKLEYELSNYHEVNGILIPHKVRLTTPGSAVDSPQMTIRVNVRPRSNLFLKPPRFEDGPDAWKAP